MHPPPASLEPASAAPPLPLPLPPPPLLLPPPPAAAPAAAARGAAPPCVRTEVGRRRAAEASGRHRGQKSPRRCHPNEIHLHGRTSNAQIVPRTFVRQLTETRYSNRRSFATSREAGHLLEPSASGVERPTANALLDCCRAPRGRRVPSTIPAAAQTMDAPAASAPRPDPGSRAAAGAASAPRPERGVLRARGWRPLCGSPPDRDRSHRHARNPARARAGFWRTSSDSAPMASSVLRSGSAPDRGQAVPRGRRRGRSWARTATSIR